MCSELRKKKYQHVFDIFLDYNGDGQIDKEDVDLIVSKICQVRKYNPGTPEFKYVQDLWYEILDSLLKDLDTNKDGSISREEWAVLNDKFTKNPLQPPKWQTLYEDWVLKYFNPKNEPGISRDNYVEIMTFYGLPEDDVRKAFDRMSQGKDHLTEGEYRQMWKEYFTSDDPEALGNNLGIFT